MDAAQFDRLTRALRSGTNRRSLLTGLGAGVLAGLVAPLASAAKREHRATKHRQDTKRRKRQIEVTKKTCRPAGHPCEGNQSENCCAGLDCVDSGPGAARRCTPPIPPPQGRPCPIRDHPCDACPPFGGVCHVASDFRQVCLGSPDPSIPSTSCVIREDCGPDELCSIDESPGPPICRPVCP
jgi:hypothetical protein